MSGLSPQELVELEITGLGEAGEGVGRAARMAVFVPGGVPGDHLQVRITEVRRNYARGAVTAVLRPSPARVEPACPVVTACGGCQLQHIAYPEQLRLKTRLVRDAIERIAHLDPGVVKDAIGAGAPWGYRNKALFPVGLSLTPTGRPRVIAGLYARGTHRVIDAPGCLIQHSVNNEILAAARRLVETFGYSVYDERTGRGLVRHILARVARRTGQAMAVLVTNGRHLPRGEAFARELMAAAPAVVSVAQNVNQARTNVVLGDETRILAGRPAIEDELGGLRFLISPRSFFQVNPSQAEVLYARALGYAGLTGRETVVDAYAGVGTIALYLARHAAAVIGVEVVPEAVEDAKANAQLNAIENAEFRCGSVEEVAQGLLAEGLRPQVVVLDPPRKGTGLPALEAFARMAPDRIVYVSCNPATLARDLAALASRGYALREVQPVDMFPQTSHVESVILMTNSGLKGK